MARRVAALLFFLFFLLMSREPPWGDARITFETARALLDRGSLDLQIDAPSYFFTVYAGKKYGFATLGNVLASLPSLLLYRALSALSSQPLPALYALCSHVSAALLMALTCGLFFGLCRSRGARPRLALLLSLGLGLSTICFCYARSPYSESLQTFALLWLIERALKQAQPEQMTLPGMASLGAAAGIVLNAKLVYAAVLPLPALYVAWFLLRATRPSTPSNAGAADAASPSPLTLTRVAAGLGVALLAFLPFVALVMWHNFVKTGSPFRTGYWGDLFSGQLWPALYGYTLSSGQSIFLYSPPLLLALLGLRAVVLDSDRARRQQSALIGLCIAVVTLLNAKYFLWHGAFCWGPRLMVPLTPLILLLCLPWLDAALARGHSALRHAALSLLLIVGGAVQLVGASLYWDHFLRIATTVRDALGGTLWSPDYLPHVYFVPQFAPLRGHPWLLSHLLRRDPNLTADAPWRALFARPIDVSMHYGRLRLDYWLLDWGSHPLLGTLILATLLLAAGLCARSLLRTLRALERQSSHDH